MVDGPITDQGIVDCIPDDAGGGNHTGMGNLNTQNIGQEEQIEQILEVKDHVTCGGEGTEAQLFQKADASGLG